MRENNKMAKIMTIYVSKTDNLASFGDYFFDKDDADKMKKFAETLGYKTAIEKCDERFANELNPFRKIQVRDIDWSNYKNVLFVIKNRDKTDEEIVKGLKSKGSGFSITVKRGQIMTEYSNLLELDGNNIDDEKLVEFAKRISSRFLHNKAAIKDIIKKLQNAGCTVSKREGFPECKTGFTEACFNCQFNTMLKKPLKNDIDLNRFNTML